MTLRELAAAGHTRVRLPYWADPDDYVLLHITAEGLPGPWGYLYSPLQLELSGFDRPQTFLLIGGNDLAWEPYTGPPAPDEQPCGQ